MLKYCIILEFFHAIAIISIEVLQLCSYYAHSWLRKHLKPEEGQTSVGVLLISCALLLCIFLVWVFVVEWLSKLRKCVYYTIASTVAVFATVLIPCLVLSLFSVPGFFILALVHVCNSISSITMYDCNLVFFLWCIIGHLLMLWSCFCFLCSASLWALLLCFVKL